MTDTHTGRRRPGGDGTVSTETWPEQQPQRQDSLNDQLDDLHRVAARLGMYDAADWLWKARAAQREAPGMATVLRDAVRTLDAIAATRQQGEGER